MNTIRLREEFKDEVDRSYALLQIGEKTEFTRSLEKWLSDPLGDFSSISDKIDGQGLPIN